MKKLAKIQTNEKSEQAFILEKHIATTSDRETTNPCYKDGILNKRMRNKRIWLPGKPQGWSGRCILSKDMMALDHQVKC